MSNSIFFPESLKSNLQQIATARKFPRIQRLLERGGPDELILDSLEEAQEIMDVARLELLEAQLKYPYWDEDKPDFDPKHEDGFHDIQMGVYEKTASYLFVAFEVSNGV